MIPSQLREDVGEPLQIVHKIQTMMMFIDNSFGIAVDVLAVGIEERIEFSTRAL